MNEYKIPNTDKWKRKLLLASCTNVPLVLQDHRERAAVTIENNSITRADVAGRDDDPIDFIGHVGLQVNPSGMECYHLVAHINISRQSYAKNPENAEGCPVPLFPPGTKGKKVIALQATTKESLSSQHEPLVEVDGNFYVWLSMKDRSAYRRLGDWLPEFLALDFEKAQELAKLEARAKAFKFEDAFAHFLDIIFPRVENLLAFRLLCEAKQMCGKLSTGEFKGMTIHAPQEINDWLAPFGERGADKIDQVAGMIASGTERTAVKKVLEAANRKDTTTLLDEIAAFLGDQDKLKTQAAS